MNPRLTLRVADYVAPEVDIRFNCNDKWAAGGTTTFHFAELTFISNRALIGDSNNNRIYTQAPALIWPTAGSLPDHNDPERHRGRANYVFCDGHAGSLNSTQGLLAIGDPEFFR